MSVLIYCWKFRNDSRLSSEEDQKLFYNQKKENLNKIEKIRLFFFLGSYSAKISNRYFEVITGYSSFLEVHLINGSFLLFFIQLSIKMMSWLPNAPIYSWLKYSYIFINLYKLNLSLVILSDMSAEQLFKGDISLQILMISAFSCLLCF